MRWVPRERLWKPAARRDGIAVLAIRGRAIFHGAYRLKTLALIPARGGSKGIPRKNIKLLAGKPLIAWTIEAALRSRRLDDVVVSTEDEEIAEVARTWGARVPFLRPGEMARDDTPGLDPVMHAIEQLPDYGAVLLLQPTSPLRTTEDIDGCIDRALGLEAASVVSVSEPEKHPYWMFRVGVDQRLQPLVDVPLVARRQDLPSVYALNGALYYARIDWLRLHRTLVSTETVAYVMPPERSVDVDTLLDWQLVEILLTSQK